MKRVVDVLNVLQYVERNDVIETTIWKVERAFQVNAEVVPFSHISREIGNIPPQISGQPAIPRSDIEESSFRLPKRFPDRLELVAEDVFSRNRHPFTH